MDMDFILNTLSRGDRKKKAIEKLIIREKNFIDHLLDRVELFDQIAREREFTRISPSLYFYVLMRHGLKRSGIDNRAVSDYIATLLAEFVIRERLYRVSITHDEIYHYVVDLLGSLDGADPRNKFLIRTHIGNYSLFLLGIFLEYIRSNHEYGRSIPGINYYEEMGSTSYIVAAENRFAEQLELVEVLTLMGENFHIIRKSLNYISENYLHLHSV